MPKNIKPKLLHITSSLKMGGAERVLVDLIEALADDFEHEVIFFYDGPHRQTLEARGVRCQQVKGIIYLYDPIFWLRLARAISTVRPSCIHSLLWGANWSSRLLGPLFKIPVVNALHNNMEGYSWLRRLLDQATFVGASRFVAVSDGVVLSHMKGYPQFKKLPLSLIPNGIALSQEPPYERSFVGVPDDAYVIGFVGRFEPEKNPLLLVEAFAVLSMVQPQVRLVLVGYGSLESQLRERVHECGLNEKVILVCGQKAGRYYGLFDCFVQCSPREGLSIAILEAMAYGVPCVVANVDGVHPVIVQGENGVIVPEYNARAISECIQHLMVDPISSKRMSEEAKKEVLIHYTLDRMASSYSDLFYTCMKK